MCILNSDNDRVCLLDIMYPHTDATLACDEECLYKDKQELIVNLEYYAHNMEEKKYEKLRAKLHEVLSKETKESLSKWLEADNERMKKHKRKR